MKISLSLALRRPRQGRRKPSCGCRPLVDQLEDRSLLAAPFAVGGDPSVVPADFRVTTFASGLNFPYGMQQLSDGSLLVATSRPIFSPGSFYESTGELIRLVDADGNGEADGPATVMATGLPGWLTSVRVAGDLVFATSSQEGNQRITVLRAGATPNDSLTQVGSINFVFPGVWWHTTYALAVRPTPGAPGQYDLFFNVGSQYNFEPTTHVVSVSGLITAGLNGDSIYMVTVDPAPATPVLSNLTRIATGLRNAAGIVVHPTTGDLYFEDNGIDGFVDGHEPTSADELNRIAFADLGGAIEDFGYPNNYIEYRSGREVGSGGIDPLFAFQPIPDPSNGSESEGPVEIALAPPGFPSGLNNGVFVGFHGRGGTNGLANEENPLVFANLATGGYFHFISNNEPSIGHLDGLLSTSDSLFVADIDTTGRLFDGAGAGVIYQIRAIPASPPGGTGLLGTYFATADLSGPATLTRVDASVGFDWGVGSPDPALPADRFSARWSGSIQAPSTETYTFRTTSDDGVRLWVDGRLLIDHWGDHAPAVDAGAIALEAGRRYAIRMEYYENAGGAVAQLRWSSPSLPEQVIPAGYLFPDASPPGGTGLLGTYFATADLSGPATLTRVDASVGFDWGVGSPDPALPADRFSARWSGSIQAPSTETYTFRTTSDDGVRLWVDGRLLIDHWGDHAPAVDAGAIALEAGRRYAIRMEYYENAGGAVAQLRWSSPSLPEQVIPAGYLFPDASPPGGTGLLGTYFATADLSGPATLTRVDASVGFDWGVGSPDPALPADRFSARWSGSIQAPSTETYTFRTTSDDGVRLWVDGRLLIDHWGDHAPAVDAGAIALEAGRRYAIRMEYYENAGGAVAQLRWSSPSLPEQVIPAGYLFPDASPPGGTGLLGTYFATADLSGPATLTRVDASVGFDWGVGSPDPALPADRFSARWSGSIQAPSTETYTFRTTSDDGVRLWVDGRLLIDHWGDHAPAVDAGAIALEAGRRYAIRMEYYENAGGAVAQLRWSSPSLPEQVIPAGYLFPDLAEAMGA